jgi:hypothetical protein
MSDEDDTLAAFNPPHGPLPYEVRRLTGLAQSRDERAARAAERGYRARLKAAARAPDGVLHLSGGPQWDEGTTAIVISTICRVLDQLGRPSSPDTVDAILRKLRAQRDPPSPARPAASACAETRAASEPPDPHLDAITFRAALALGWQRPLTPRPDLPDYSGAGAPKAQAVTGKPVDAWTHALLLRVRDDLAKGQRR